MTYDSTIGILIEKTVVAVPLTRRQFVTIAGWTVLTSSIGFQAKEAFAACTILLTSTTLKTSPILLACG